MNLRRPPRRRGSVLLLVLFLMAFTAPLLALAFEAHTDHLRCVHNDVDIRTALYIAEAGVKDALAQLLRDPGWRVGFVNQPFPPDLGHTYTVTIEDNPEGPGLRITSVGRIASGCTKTITAIVTGF